MLSAALDACVSEELVYALVAGELDPEHREAITDHLDACERCRRLVVESSRALAGPQDAEDTRRYEVITEIGRGGMGVVYRAHDQVLQRDVALKLIRREMAYDAATRRRLIRESKIMARLRHPNVAQVYDAGVLDGQLYLAMELIEGTTLREWGAQPRTTRAILDCLCAAGAGLAAAHEAGLVHRDFKPDNVLVDATGRPHVTDFGLARAAETNREDGVPRLASESPAIDEVTRTGSLAGTPVYMAPEQTDGDKLGPAADIFAFCVSAWETLHDQRPFREDSMTARREAIARGELRASRSRAVPRHVRNILAAGLAENPEARPSSIEDIVAALARPRRRWRWIGASAALATGVLGWAVLSPPAPPACPQFEGPHFDWPARAPEVRDAVARQTPGQSGLGWLAARDDIDSSIATLHQAHAQTCAPAEQALSVVNAARRNCIADRTAMLSAHLEMAAAAGDTRALRSAGRITPHLCRVTPATDLLRSFSAVRMPIEDAIKDVAARRVAGRHDGLRGRIGTMLGAQDLHPVHRARLLRQRGLLLQSLGDTDAAAASFAGAFELARAAGSSRLAVLTATALSRIAVRQLELAEARRWLARARSLVDDTDRGPWRDHLEAHYLAALGMAERIAGNPDDAHQALSRALELVEAQLPEQAGAVMLDLVSLKVRSGSYDDAVPHLEELVQWSDASWGEHSSEAHHARVLQGFALSNLGRFSEAHAVMTTALTHARDVADPARIRVCLLALTEIAIATGTNDELSEIAAELEAAMAGGTRSAVEERLIVSVRCKVARALGNADRFERCRVAYEDALSRPEIPDALVSAGYPAVYLEVERNDPARAVEIASLVDQRVREALGDDHHEASPIVTLAYALLENGRPDEARRQLERLDGQTMAPIARATFDFLWARVLGHGSPGRARAQAALGFWRAHPEAFADERAEAEAWLRDGG